jgi:hypothetical protein
MRLTDLGNHREYGGLWRRVWLHADHPIEIYRWLSESNDGFVYEFGDWRVESLNDFDQIKQTRKPPRRIYVRNRDLSLSVYPHLVQLNAHGKLTNINGQAFIAVDNLLRRQTRGWNIPLFLLLLILSINWIIQACILLGVMNLSSLLKNIILAATGAYCAWFVLFHIRGLRYVQIKWPSRPHAVLAQTIASVVATVIGGLILAFIVFLIERYFNPDIKPYLDKIFATFSEISISTNRP